MKLSKLIIKNFQQFQDVELDLTYPKDHPDPSKAGKPLEKVCFIGKNGTGKSTLLKLIKRLILNNLDPLYIPFPYSKEAPVFIACKINAFDEERFLVSMNSGTLEFKASINNEGNWIPDFININCGRIIGNVVINGYLTKYLINDNLFQKTLLNEKASSLITYSPAESSTNAYASITDVPDVKLNEALSLFDDFPFYNTVDFASIDSFWKLLTYQLKKRENDLRSFQNKEENLDKTIRQIQHEFNQNNPSILDSLGELWNSILNKAGLEFDVQGASNPIQLTDVLKAYIKLKSTGKTIPYANLSTGIRNFIFRLGHIYSLYFNRNIQRGILLVDEPENSLFPDFLYGLVAQYESIIQNTQLFMATHSPIIAAQFDPSERIILDFDEKGHVVAKKGVSPQGDDPNDMLTNDFEVESILGEKGLEMWNRYVALKSMMKDEQDTEKKKAYIAEFMEIGNRYNFG